MRKMLIIIAAAALLAPVAAMATAPQSSNASRTCTALKATMGATAFAQAYPTFGACVSAVTPLDKSNTTSAQSLCTAEQNDANFAASHNGKTFAQFYGTGKSGKDAFGRCVSQKAQASSQAIANGQSNPAKTCSAQRTQMGVSAFDKLYGVNGNAKNAFGKCVSKAARAQVNAETSSAQLCLTEQSLSGFAAHWGTNANLSNAFGKCVSSTAKNTEAKQQQSTVHAAKACLALLTSEGASTFKSTYPTFGACVSAKAKA